MNVGVFTALLVFLAPALAWADVEIVATRLRDYATPAGFDATSASVASATNGTTFIAGTVGQADDAECSVVVAKEDGAREFAFQFDGRSTSCIGITAHPVNGFFVRGYDPSSMAGDVTGFTAYIDDDGTMVWKVPDQEIVTALDDPTGPGDFLGNYVTPLRPLAYSEGLERVIGFSVGSIAIGFDEKYIGQAHVINNETGFLTANGQAFGLNGVGIVAGTVVRDDGLFIVRYYVNGQQGSTFYNYDGRTSISEFNPGDEDWSERWVWQMRYANRAAYLVYTETDELDERTRVMAANNDGAPLYDVEFENLYRFRDGEGVLVGLPTNLWVTRDYAVVSYVPDGTSIYLRLIDQNGDSPGMARLSGLTEDPPLALIEGPEGSLRLITQDIFATRLTEYALEFQDVDAFDPDAGFGDVGIEVDLGLGTAVEVLDEIGCACGSVSRRASAGPAAWLALLGLGVVSIRRSRRDAE